MRRLLMVVVTALSIAVLAPTMTLAAPPLRESETETSLFCAGLSGEAGIANMFAVSSDFSFPFGGLDLWTTGDPASTRPNIVGGGSVDWDGQTMTATFDLVELIWSSDPDEPPAEVPAGTATFNATLPPDGRPQVVSSFKEHDGNRIVRGAETFQPHSVEGTLDVDLLTRPTAEYDMSGCSATSRTLSFSITNPTARVAALSSQFVTCRWETPDGHVGLGARSDTGVVEVFEGESRYFGVGEVVLTPSAFQAEYVLFDGLTGEEVGVTSGSATLTRAEPIDVRERFHDSKVDMTGWRLSVDGTLSVMTPSGTTSYVMDDASCIAADLQIKTIETEPHGPRLKNDVPSRAHPIALGQTDSVWTGVSAAEPEASCVGGGPLSHLISHTGWWTFVGTGTDVTIDTAGSDIDTILGVYQPVDGGFDQVGCVDDVFGSDGERIVQAAMTVGTVAGTTYYIQAGGLLSSGQLMLTVD